jgi:hypothetical protein
MIAVVVFDVGSGNGDDKSDVHPRDPAAKLVHATAADHTRLCKYRSGDCLLVRNLRIVSPGGKG